MVNYIVKRILISILVVFLVSLFVFSIMHLLPGDPARLALGYEASEEDVQRLREQYNLDKPLVEQYVLWMGGIFHGDFGESLSYHRPVLDLLKERIPRTVALGLPAMIIAIISGIVFGILCAVKRGKVGDQIITFFATLGAGTPQYWLGMLCIIVFATDALGMNILPMQGFVAPSENFVGYLEKAILPVFCMAVGMIATLTRQTRSNMLEVINQDYIRTARANGLPEHSVIFRHALKNALIPVVTIIGMQVRVVIGGAVLVERVFNIVGVGSMMTSGISNRDYWVVQSCVLIIAMFTVAANLIVDILYGFIDPRIREARR